jgi:MoaA/NifB/PqqE/SkfB family radical SAM enzyme
VAIRATRIGDLARLIPHGGPAICNISVTNVCNATCSFCNFAHDKGFVTSRTFLDANRFAEAIEVLRDRAMVRFITFMGGEPLLHPKFAEMVRLATAAGMQPTLVTNGWLLPPKVRELADAGVSTIFISVDSHDAGVHERNRGLKGSFARIAAAIERMRACGMTAIASVAMTRLVTDYPALAATLTSLGFAAVTFSYPRKAALGSSSLVYSEDSPLVDLTTEELLAAFESVDAIRETFPVHNPRASVADMKRRLRGEAERFGCLAGYKYFYVDWNYEMWRCEDWRESLGALFAFDRSRMIRDGCQACMTDCYRDASVMLQFGVALGDTFARLREGRVGAASAAIADRRNLTSIRAVMDHGGRLSRLAGLG